MKSSHANRPARAAILAIAGVKAAVAAFDRGEVNVFEALDEVRAALATGHAAIRMHRGPARSRRRAA